MMAMLKRAIFGILLLMGFAGPIILWAYWPKLHSKLYGDAAWNNAKVAEYGQFGDSYGALNAVFTGGALVVTMFGLLLVYQQLLQVERTIRGGTYATLCQQSIEILKSIASQKEFYPFFYYNKKLTNDDLNRAEILCMTEMVANYLDMVALQKGNMPEAVWNRWKNFILDSFKRSAVVRQHMQQFSHWYSEELCALASEARISGSDQEPVLFPETGERGQETEKRGQEPVVTPDSHDNRPDA